MKAEISLPDELIAEFQEIARAMNRNPAALLQEILELDLRLWVAHVKSKRPAEIEAMS